MNDLFDKTSAFLSRRPGLLPLISVFLIILNWILRAAIGDQLWLVQTDFLLHFGLVIGIIGLLLIKPLQ